MSPYPLLAPKPDLRRQLKAELHRHPWQALLQARLVRVRVRARARVRVRIRLRVRVQS